MMYNYPFFSFPHFRRYTNYYPVPYSYGNPSSINKPIIEKQSRQFKGQYYQLNSQNIGNHQRINEKQAASTCSNHKSKERDSSKRTPSGFSFLSNILHQEDREDDEKYFDLFGLKLYNDDLLLIGLIFFLYKEDVKDQYLFFALVLLLLS